MMNFLSGYFGAVFSRNSDIWYVPRSSRRTLRWQPHLRGPAATCRIGAGFDGLDLDAKFLLGACNPPYGRVEERFIPLDTVDQINDF